MNVLNVIYKDTTVNINYLSINIDTDYIQIFFVRTQDNDCKFFCQWLDANRIDYEKKERDLELIMKRKKEILIRLLKLILIYLI